MMTVKLDKINMATITEEKLKYLVKNIVKQLVQEYSVWDNSQSSPSTGTTQPNNTDNQVTDPNNMSATPMSTSDKMKLDKIKKTQTQNDIKQKQLELDTVKKKLDFTKKDQDQMKRSQIPTLQKSIQQLKSQH
jgi:hypothetical protein